jgi:hypothetical protein
MPYRTVFTRKAPDFICHAGGDEMLELEGSLDQVERSPGMNGDYAATDFAGRELQVVTLRQITLAYWTDHAVREVRIVWIESNV